MPIDLDAISLSKRALSEPSLPLEAFLIMLVSLVVEIFKTWSGVGKLRRISIEVLPKVSVKTEEYSGKITSITLIALSLREAIV